MKQYCILNQDQFWEVCLNCSGWFDTDNALKLKHLSNPLYESKKKAGCKENQQETTRGASRPGNRTVVLQWQIFHTVEDRLKKSGSGIMNYLSQTTVNKVESVEV